MTTLDRLGRHAMDVRKTVEELADRGIRIHCLALGCVDLTSAAGRMTMQELNAVSQFERDLLIERMQAGISRARAEGATSLGGKLELAAGPGAAFALSQPWVFIVKTILFVDDDRLRIVWNNTKSGNVPEKAHSPA